MLQQRALRKPQRTGKVFLHGVNFMHLRGLTSDLWGTSSAARATGEWWAGCPTASSARCHSRRGHLCSRGPTQTAGSVPEPEPLLVPSLVKQPGVLSPGHGEVLTRSEDPNWFPFLKAGISSVCLNSLDVIHFNRYFNFITWFAFCFLLLSSQERMEIGTNYWSFKAQ